VSHHATFQPFGWASTLAIAGAESGRTLARDIIEVIIEFAEEDTDKPVSKIVWIASDGAEAAVSSRRYFEKLKEEVTGRDGPFIVSALGKRRVFFHCIRAGMRRRRCGRLRHRQHEPHLQQWLRLTVGADVERTRDLDDEADRVQHLQGAPMRDDARDDAPTPDQLTLVLSPHRAEPPPP
jgi:hypothetical protein